MATEVLNDGAES